MKKIMNNLLEALRERVVQNLSIIRQNEVEIKKILKEPLSAQRSYNLNNRYELSKKVLKENQENLDIQHKITAFINKHNDSPEFANHLDQISRFENDVINSMQEDSINLTESKVQDDTGIELPQSDTKGKQSVKQKQSAEVQEVTQGDVNESIFVLTVNGKLAFNRAHPQFNNEKFFNRLLDYHTQREEYEICAQLVKYRK